MSTVAEEEKVKEVAKVFHSVAGKYDVMNDLMSAGLHRLWKTFTIANAAVRPGMKILEVSAKRGVGMEQWLSLLDDFFSRHQSPTDGPSNDRLKSAGRIDDREPFAITRRVMGTIHRGCSAFATMCSAICFPQSTPAVASNRQWMPR